MDYIHKFSIGPVEMDKMLVEYHQLRKPAATARHVPTTTNIGPARTTPSMRLCF